MDSTVWNFYHSLAQGVLQARLDLAHLPHTQVSKWFLLETPIYQEILDKVFPWKDEPSASAFVIDLLVNYSPPADGATPPRDQEPIHLERWTVSYSKRNSSTAPTHSTKEENYLAYKELTLLLRSVYSSLRLLPAYQLVRDLRRNKLINAHVTFRIHSNDRERPLFTEPPLRQEFSRITVGDHSVALSLLYRADCRFHEEIPHTVLNSQFIIRDYAPGPSTSAPARTSYLPVDSSPNSVGFVPVASSPRKDTLLDTPSFTSGQPEHLSRTTPQRVPGVHTTPVLSAASVPINIGTRPRGIPSHSPTPPSFTSAFEYASSPPLITDTGSIEESPQLQPTLLRKPPIVNSFRERTRRDGGVAGSAPDHAPLSFGRVALSGTSPTQRTSLLYGVVDVGPRLPTIPLFKGRTSSSGTGMEDDTPMLSAPIARSHLLSGVHRGASDTSLASCSSLSSVEAEDPVPDLSAHTTSSGALLPPDSSAADGEERESAISEFITYCNATPDLSALVTEQPVGALFPELERLSQLLDST
mmetsp:Transcript_1640/g.5085  ORF Transcript_1640/g.5085 Transcript_1640/m.5085 type:complete len:528 (+) Transcript_1640:59-1642(+)